MTGSNFRFLRCVQIRGEECGAVARALHHANGIRISFKPV